MENLKEMVEAMAKAGVTPEEITKFIIDQKGDDANEFIVDGVLNQARQSIAPEVLTSTKCGSIALDFMTAVTQGIQLMPNDLSEEKSGLVLAKMVLDVLEPSVNRLNAAAKGLRI